MKQGLLRGETIWHILSIILTFVLNFIIMLFFWDVFRQLGEIAGLGDTYPFFKTGMYRGLNEIEIAALSVLLPTLLTVLPFIRCY